MDSKVNLKVDLSGFAKGVSQAVSALEELGRKMRQQQGGALVHDRAKAELFWRQQTRIKTEPSFLTLYGGGDKGFLMGSTEEREEAARQMIERYREAYPQFMGDRLVSPFGAAGKVMSMNVNKDLSEGLGRITVRVGNHHVEFPIRTSGCRLEVLEMLGECSSLGPTPEELGAYENPVSGAFFEVWARFNLKIPQGVYILAGDPDGTLRAVSLVTVGDVVEVDKEGDPNHGREGPVVDILFPTQGVDVPTGEVWFEDGRRRYGVSDIKPTGRQMSDDALDGLPEVPLIKDE